MYSCQFEHQQGSSMTNFNTLFFLWKNESSLQVFDILIRDGSLWPMQLLRTHKSLRTFLFMVLSGIIVDSMYLNSESMLWLFKPLKKYRKPIDGRCANGANCGNDVHGIKPIKGLHVCHHKDSCNSHISQVRISMRPKRLFWLNFSLLLFCLILGIQNLFDSRHRFGNPKICIWQFWCDFGKSSDRFGARYQKY